MENRHGDLFLLYQSMCVTEILLFGLRDVAVRLL